MSHERGAQGYRILSLVGTVLMATGVALGAFGAHTIEDSVTPSRLATLETAVRYQLIHGVGLLAIAGLQRGRRAGWTIAAGTTLFSVSLYVLVLTDTPWLGAVAPIGGAAMIFGWCWLAWEVWRPAQA